MPPLSLLNLVAVSVLCILTASFGTQPVAAVSVPATHGVRSSHAGMSKRRRSDNAVKRQCKPKPAPGTTSPVASQPASSPKPTPSPQPTPQTPSAPSGGNGSAKRGIAWALGNDPSLQFWKSDKVQYLYTWSAYFPSNAKKLGYTPLAMFWGAKSQADFVKMVVNGPDDYADYVLAFNEPDLGDQSGMSVGQAVSLWNQFIEPLHKRNYQLISPATTGGNKRGDDWMEQFVDQCKGCHIDGMAIHYYGTNPQDLIKYAESRYNKYKMDLWITEFACQDFGSNPKPCDANMAKNFLDTILQWADNTSYVKAVCPFGVMHDMNNVAYTNQLMSGSGQPNSLGNTFLYL